MHNIHDLTIEVEMEGEPCETAEEVELGSVPFTRSTLCVGEQLFVGVNRPTVVYTKPDSNEQ